MSNIHSYSNEYNNRRSIGEQRIIGVQRFDLDLNVKKKYIRHVIFEENGIVFQTTIHRITQDYIVCFGMKHYFDNIKNMHNYMTGESISKEMLYEWYNL